MRSRLRVPLAVFAAAAAVFTAAMAACSFTDDLTGGPADGSDGGACNIAQCPQGPNSAPTCAGGACSLLCATGFADCDDAGDNGCETNIANSSTPQQAASKNCGKCGHDCLGGTCSNGACQPVRLASGDHTPDRIVLSDDDMIYGVNTHSGEISRIAKDAGGGSPAVLYRERQGVIPPLAFGNGAVYFAAPSAVKRVHPDGGTATLAPAASPSGIALGGTNALYWVEAEGAGSLGIHKCTLPSCAQAASIDAGAGPIHATAADGQGVYWATDTDIFSNGSPSPLTAASHPYGLEIASSGTLYYFESTDAGTAIRACDRQGCTTPVPVVYSQFSPIALAVDSSSVFWTTADGAIKSVARGGESPPSVVEKILYQRHTKFQPWDIAADKSAIYFTDVAPSGSSRDGTLYKLAKP